MASSKSRVLVLLALTANSLIAVLKFVAAAISGSAAMLAEAFHSVADSGNQLFLLRGTAASKFRPTVQFPFGRGKELYFWSFMVAVFLFVGGGVVAFMQGLDRLRHPEHQAAGLMFNLIVLGVAALFEIFIAFRPAVQEFNRRRGGRKVWRTIRDSKDPALLIVLFEDAVAVLGIAVAMAGLLIADVTGDSRWDGLASIVIGVLLAVTAWILAIETKGLLVGEAASRSTRSVIRSATLSIPEVETVDRLLTMHLGPDEILINMDVVVDRRLSGLEVERIVDSIEAKVREFVPEATRIFVEVGPGP
ncbi:MAG: cation diffusion facilitator family transporter [Acidimicrobiia bacterium]